MRRDNFMELFRIGGKSPDPNYLFMGEHVDSILFIHLKHLSYLKLFGFVTLNTSPFFEGIMRADRSHQYMVSMMSVKGNTEMQMLGNILQISLTLFLSLPWWMGRYSVHTVTSHQP